MKAIRQAIVLAVCLMLSFAVSPAYGQTAITQQTSVPLAFAVGSSLSINCTTPTFTVVGNTATSSTITCTSSWNLSAAQGYGLGICLAQWVTSATPFGTGGPASSAMTANANGGGFGPFPSAAALITPQVCGNTLGTALGAQYFGPNLFSSSSEPVQSSRTDTDVVAVNLTGVAVGSYTGNLNFAIGVQ